MRIDLNRLTALVAGELQRAGANEPMAHATAKALVLAESQGLGSHGLSRVAQYATHLRNGRANGEAVPVVTRRKGGSLVVDAQEGLAFAACELAIREAIVAAKENGVADGGRQAGPAHSRGLGAGCTRQPDDRRAGGAGGLDVAVW